jgi:hypothetical protein
MDEEVGPDRNLVFAFPSHLGFVVRSSDLARDLAKPRVEPDGRVNP